MCCEKSKNSNIFSSLEISIFDFFCNSCVISRSEGRSLAKRFIDSNNINLDFANIEEIGQAFAHEIFVLWQENHPNVTINTINTNEDVEFMIKRVKNTKY